MRRRELIMAVPICAMGSMTSSLLHAAAETWGAELSYPSGWDPDRHWQYKPHRVGNFSGGYEQMFKFNTIEAGPVASPLDLQLIDTKKFSFPGQTTKNIDDYLNRWPTTGLLIARKGKIFIEAYRMERKPEMRFQSWSMAKSVTSLLMGIALDKGFIQSIDDLPEKYVPQLKGTLLGGIPIRHLLNMSSGVDVIHERDPYRIDWPALLAPGPTSVGRVVIGWKEKKEEPGIRFNYTELCPLTIGMVIRNATQKTLAQFAQQHLWQPMGAEGNATWLTDSQGFEYNCVGFGAQLRDWARLAQLVAQKGRMGSTQVVSKSWIEDCTKHGPADAQAAYGKARSAAGYKNFFWHNHPQGRWLAMNGALGQKVLIDMETETVLIHTSVSDEVGPWNEDLFPLFVAAINLKS